MARAVDSAFCCGVSVPPAQTSSVIDSDFVHGADYAALTAAAQTFQGLIGAGARVMVATRPVDFRKGADSLTALVAAEYGGDPFSGVVYVFRAKRSDRIKLVWWDGTGLCLMAKRLEEGGFKWPGIRDGVMRLTAAQLGALLEGLDWRRVHGGRRPRAPQIAG